MNQRISNSFSRLRNQFNVNVKVLNKECSFPLLTNITHIQKRCKGKLAKPNLFLSENWYKTSEKKEKIGFYGYFLLSIPIGTFMLGTWQIQRLRWKSNLIETLNTHITHKPIELPAVLQDLESREYYPVKVKGQFLYEKEFVVGLRNLIVNGESVDSNSGLLANNNTQKGYHVITPFKLADRDETILVNRGWIPKALKSPETRRESQIEGIVEIVGIIRLNEKRPQFVPKNSGGDLWYYRDINTMAKNAETSPVYIDLVDNTNSFKYPQGGQTQVKLRNEHLSYIITWYSLSLITAYMWYRQFIKKIPIAY